MTSDQRIPASETASPDAAPAGARAAHDGDWRSAADVVAIQRRSVRLLIIAQIVGGIGIGAGASLGALLAESVTSSESWAGLARTCSTLGAAFVALPLAVLATRRGRNTALGLGWALACLGAIVLVGSAVYSNPALLIVGMLMFGSGTATNLQSRYAATDLAQPRHRARTLSLVVWSTTIGSVLGPNLSGLGATVAGWFGLPSLSGGFLISALVLGLGAVVMWVFMRPDPLLTAQLRSRAAHPDRQGAARSAAPSGGVDAPHRPGRFAVTFRAIADSPVTRFAFVTVVLGNTVMAAVMTMTPVHMADDGANLDVIGLTISVHVLGMFGLSPVVGIISDRLGRIPAILIGQVIFVASAFVAGLAGSSTVMITIGLFLLGLGWSFSLVAGSALLGESVPEAIRTTVQGTGDMTMNLFAAIAAGFSGIVLDTIGFGGLNAIAGILTIPVLLLMILTTVSGRRVAELRR
jgi:MFS family permease